MRVFLVTACCALLVGCASTSPTPSEQTATVSAAVASGTDARRSFAPRHEGEPIVAGISYGPYRRGQAPGGPLPSDAELEEDLRIIAKRWHMLRIYGAGGPAEPILRIIRDESLPIVVMLGAWIAPDSPEQNQSEVDSAIRLANAYPEQVAAVSIGNESQVFWSGHRTPRDVLLKHLKRARAAVAQPVTTADDYNFWNKPESEAVAAEVDFIVLHAYAMWNGKTLENAVKWTAEIIESIRQKHPGMPIVIGETGWATELNPEGNEGKYIKAPAGEAEQRTFYREWAQWAALTHQPYFYFSAFDEPWKGSDNPREVEKHWGLYDVDRKPKPALQDP